MTNVRVERMLRELRSEPATDWFYRLLRLDQPRPAAPEAPRGQPLPMGEPQPG